MAIAGSSTSAYLCHLDRDNNLITQPTTSQRGLCFAPDYAVAEIINRKLIVVASGDVTKVREMVGEMVGERLNGKQTSIAPPKL